MFTTGVHEFLLPSEQIEELKGTVFKSFCYALPDFSEEHIELEAWKCSWSAKDNNAKLFIQSSLDLARLVDADGIILKKDDLPPDLVRKQLGSNKMIGGLAGNYKDALNLILEGVDFIMLGPLYDEKGQKEIGMDRLKTILVLFKENNVDVPVWIYGGINPDHAVLLSGYGVEGVSVSSFVLNDDEIDKKAAAFNIKKG